MTKLLKKYWGYGVLLAVLLTVPLWVKNDYYQTVFNFSLIAVIVVLGMNFVTGLVGQMNLGMAGLYACGCYTYGILNGKLGLDPWLCLIGAVIVGIIIGVMLGWPSLRVKGIYLALTTIGFSEIVRLLLSNLKNVTGGTQGLAVSSSLHIFGKEIIGSVPNYFLLLAAAAIAVILALRVTYSKWGRIFIAIRDNDEAIESSGINIATAKIIAFVFSSVFACVAGALYASFIRYLIPSSYTMDMSSKYLMMLMIGGIGSVPGCIIGAFLVTLLPEFLRFLDHYYLLVFAAITLLFAIFAPNGIISLLRGGVNLIRKAFGFRKQSTENLTDSSDR